MTTNAQMKSTDQKVGPCDLPFSQTLVRIIDRKNNIVKILVGG